MNTSNMTVIDWKKKSPGNSSSSIKWNIGNANDHCTTSRNPQANAVCERMHQIIGNALHVLTTMHPPEGLAEANQLIDTAIANAMFAHRAAYNSAIQTTPGGLAFGHDMVVALPLLADLQIIRAHKQQLIDRRLINANQKRFSYDYRVGESVLKLAYKPNKLEARALSGPHVIEQVHTNGTVTIRLSPTVVERISLRRIKPYIVVIVGSRRKGRSEVE